MGKIKGILGNIFAYATRANWLQAKSKLQNNFTRDEAGSTMVLFGLSAIALFAMIGLAVDYGRWLNARVQTISAADSAVLAAARALQTNGGDKADAVAIAQSYYASATKSRLKVKSDTIDFVVAQSGTEINTTGNATIDTPFLSLVGTPNLPLYHSSGIDYSQAKLAVGSNAETSLETSLILDISASMAGSKVADLKEAANDLVNIIVWQDQSSFTSKVAIVPYGVAVNAGDYAAVARGPVSSGTCTAPGCQAYKFKNTSDQNTTFNISSCVSERTGSNAYTDESPTVTYVGKNYASPNNPCLTNKVVPITSDKATLSTNINALAATGSTGGHVGVAWGWYTLSPNWNSVWPTGSKPAPYSDLTALNSRGAPKLKKIAVLMTDGEYNSPYCNGVISKDATTGSGSTADHINCNAPNGSSYYQTQAMCTAMKAAGIEIYTVGFLVIDNPNAKNLMVNCATDARHAYISANGDQLKQAFRDIALKISSIYLSK